MDSQGAALTALPSTIATFVRVAPLYWLRVLPAVTRQLRGWRERAEAIPDPTLRRHALAKLAEEEASAEGAAAFAILASRRHRLGVARACVAFEVLYDYLDALTEDHPTLSNNREMHRALCDAVGAAPTGCDYYRHHPQRDDGGYLRALVATCRSEISSLPNDGVVAEELLRITLRAGEAQSLNHAGARDGHAALAAWARSHVALLPEMRWFEVAAGAGSPLGVLALFSAASHRRTNVCEAQAIAAAYFPWVAALHWLMESVVDRADDARTGNHSYVGRYGSTREMATRLAEIADRSTRDMAQLPHAARHLLLLIGMVALNLAHADSRHPLSREAAQAVQDAIGRGRVEPFLVMFWLRNAAKALGRRWASQRSGTARRAQRDDARPRGGDIAVDPAAADRQRSVDP